VRKEIIGDCTLYLGDSLDIVSGLSGFDVLITDPPYGVNGGSGTIGKASKKTKYDADFPDTPEYIEKVCSQVVRLCIDKCGRAAVTTGTRNMFKYPEPTDIGGFTNPAGSGLSHWGMVTFQPILFYGRDPRVGKTISPMTHPLYSGRQDIDHPCPKPLKEWTWLVHKASLAGETVIDPFMGSGTTGVSCVKLGRKFIGIELDEKYFDLACSRIAESRRQPDLFPPKSKKVKQQSFL